MKEYSVLLGRFCPFHLGHQKIVDKLIYDFGEKSVLIIIGSSTTINSRTPYTFSQRKNMIRSIYPNIRILPLPDPEPNLITFHNDTNNVWLDSVEELEKRMKAKFTFFGGSVEDLKVLAERFKTKVLIDRKEKSNKISATKIRRALSKKDLKTATKMLDSKVLPLALDTRFVVN